jgi:hypothetical protein
MEQFFEKVLWQSRFLVLLAVIPSLIGAVVLFVIGSMDIFKVVDGTWGYMTGSNPVDIHETVVTDIVGAVDIYLIAIVLLIFGLGTYKLFISRIEQEEVSERTPYEHGKHLSTAIVKCLLNTPWRFRRRHAKNYIIVFSRYLMTPLTREAKPFMRPYAFASLNVGNPKGLQGLCRLNRNAFRLCFCRFWHTDS